MASDPPENQSIDEEEEIRKAHEQKIHKAFNNLKKHASIVANFTLLWQDLEDHIVSIKTQIESQITHFQSQDSTPYEPTLHQFNEKDSAFDLGTNRMESFVVGDLNFNVPMDSGKTLLMYLCENDKHRMKLRDSMSFALKGSENCGKLVLEAINEYWDNLGRENTILGFSMAVVRRSCIILLEELIGVGILIDEEVKDDAKKLVFEWKKELVISDRSAKDIQLFFMVLGAFGLVNEFKEGWIIQAFNCIVFIKEAPSVFLWLGFGNKAQDYIQRLLSCKRYLIAIAFICAFEMHDEFPPVTLIEDHLDKAKREADFILKKGRNSARALEDAADSELRALRAAWKCIQRHKLQLQYPIKKVKERRKQIKAWKRELVEAIESGIPQPHIGHKRYSNNLSSPSDQRARNKRLRGTPMVEDSPNGYATSSSSVGITEQLDYSGGDLYMSLDADAAPGKGASKPSVHKFHSSRYMPDRQQFREDMSSHVQYKGSSSTCSCYPLTSITSAPPDMQLPSSSHNFTTVPHISPYAHSSGYCECEIVSNRHSRHCIFPGVNSDRPARNARRYGLGRISSPRGVSYMRSRTPYSLQPEDRPLVRDDYDRIVIL